MATGISDVEMASGFRDGLKWPMVAFGLSLVGNGSL
jgi:hypothetical protein